MSQAVEPSEPMPTIVGQPPRWLIPVLGAAIVLMIIATNMGNILFARLLDGNQLILLALNSTNKYLLLTALDTEALPYYLISTARLLAPDPLFYILGFVYRDRALRWAKKVFPGIDPLVDQFTQDHTAFKKLLLPALVIAPNNPVCLLAGVAAIPWRVFITLNIIGTVGRVILFRQLAFIFADQVESIVDTAVKYQGWLTRGSFVLVVGYIVWQVLSGRGLAGGVDTLDEELNK